MKILAIDTTTNVLTVAITDSGRVVSEYYIDHMRTHSQKLMPVIEGMLSDAGLDISEIDGFAVANGPGSFTGIRIGLTAARTLAQATGKGIVPVNTLLGLAYNAAFTEGYVLSCLDARNGNVYCAVYRFKNGIAKQIMEPSFKSNEEVNEYLSSKRWKAYAVGDTDGIDKALVKPVDSRFNLPKASSVAFAAKADGRWYNYNDADACYISKPQAQKDLEEREKNK